MKSKIVICDHIHNAGIEFLKKQSDIELLEYADLPKDELLTKLKDCEVVITRSSTPVNEKFLDSVESLKVIVRAGVGVDNIDIESCSKRGIIVMNIPTANTIAAVELTMTHMLSAVRNFPCVNEQFKHKRIWKREDWYGTELKDKTLGVIGFGNIGSRVALRAKAFEMDIVVYDPYVKESQVSDLGMKYTSNFDEILACDIITIHTPKNSETKNMITKDEIAKMKDGVILINCARGGLYNENDILEAAKSGKIRWLGLDVFNDEPATSNPLLDLPNVYVTPHIGANTLESQEKISIQAASAALEAARGSRYANALNLPIRENEIPHIIKPYLELSQKLAFFISQINKGVINSLNISCEGQIAEYADSLATFAIVGALKHSLKDNINYVNANHQAKDRGLNVNIKKLANATSAYKNLITIEATSQSGSISLSGCVFDDDKLRIIDINGFYMDIEPSGKMIIFKNTDVPGVIGNIGNIMEKNNINIADFRLGRNNKGEALAVIIVDEDISEDILLQLSNIKACISVFYVIV